MELPVVSDNDLSSPAVLVRAVKRAEAILARTVADETILETATVFASRRYPRVGWVNFATDLRLGDPANVANAANPEAMLDRILGYFHEPDGCAYLQSADLTWRDGLAAALEKRGYRAATRHIHRLTHSEGSSRDDIGLQILPARAVYPQLRGWYEHTAAERMGLEPSVAQQHADVRIGMLDEPRLGLFVGRIDGRLVGAAGVVSLGQVGLIQGLVVSPKDNRDEISRVLLTHVIDHCARSQFESVVVELGGQDASRAALFASLGFESIGSFTRYEKTSGELIEVA